jgi:hypothetical protein
MDQNCMRFGIINIYLGVVSRSSVRSRREPTRTAADGYCKESDCVNTKKFAVIQSQAS